MTLMTLMLQVDVFLLRLWRAAQNVDLVSSNSAVEDTGDHKKQILELKLANKELWGRVEELQRENQELHRKIKSWGKLSCVFRCYFKR